MSSKVLVVDDEPMARQRVVKMLAKIEEFECVGEASNGEEALSQVELLNPDLLLLDISMPGKTGLQVAHELSERANPPAVVFCTAYDQHMLQAFSASAVGYLVKPMRQSELEETLKRSRKLNQLQLSQLEQSMQSDKQKRHICVSSLRGIELIDPTTVAACEAKEKYVTLYHQGKESLSETSLKQLESEYADELLRVHRNALVGLRFVQGLERNSSGEIRVVLKESEQRPLVSRRHLKRVKEIISNL